MPRRSAATPPPPMRSSGATGRRSAPTTPAGFSPWPDCCGKPSAAVSRPNGSACATRATLPARATAWWATAPGRSPETLCLATVVPAKAETHDTDVANLRRRGSWAPAFARAIEYAAVSSVVIPAERAAREPGSKYPCRAFFLMPGYLGPGSAAHHFVLRCARDDSRDTCDAYAIALPPLGRGGAKWHTMRVPCCAAKASVTVLLPRASE